jgi:hypothetical protein
MPMRLSPWLKRTVLGVLRRAIAFIAVLLSYEIARAAQCGGSGPDLKNPTLCSRPFAFEGACGRPNYNYPGWPDVALAVGAWEKVPIRVVAVSTDAVIETERWKNRFAKLAGIFVGNSFNDDPMTPYRYAAAGRSLPFGKTRLTVHTEQRLPYDSGMQFPAGQPMFDAHIDVHLTCEPEGALYFGNLIVWYRLDD